jgi:hypothetical protein
MQVGLMNTYDEETRHFFKHSSVRVLLCPRAGGKGHSWVKQQVSLENYYVLEVEKISAVYSLNGEYYLKDIFRFFAQLLGSWNNLYSSSEDSHCGC